jgi:hypothetical protein
MVIQLVGSNAPVEARLLLAEGIEQVALRRPSKESCLLCINSGAVVRQRTIPTERPPLVGEVSGAPV